MQLAVLVALTELAQGVQLGLNAGVNRRGV